MQFLKCFFASFLALIVFLIVSIIVISVSLGSTKEVEDDSILYLKLEGDLRDKVQDDVFNMIFGLSEDEMSLNSITKSIYNAKYDNRIKGIFLCPGIMNAGYASLSEIRAALSDFKESGKFVISYSGHYTQGGYYLASIADKILLNPMGSVDFRGMSSASFYYKDLLQKIGVDMQVFKVGTFKSFTEQYTSDSMSISNRIQMTCLTSSIWKNILDSISVSRNIPVSSLDSMADMMMTFQTADVVMERNLVDELSYYDQAEDLLKSLIKTESKDEIELLSVSDYIVDIELNESISNDQDSSKVAVVFAEGQINNGDTEGINSDNLVKILAKLQRDTTVKSVVLRVNSPGGSAYGAEQIWRAVDLLKKEKPVVVSMGDYAASGGYYISCAATKIFADPSTITGSIGVFSVIPNLDTLMQKLGIAYDVVKTNPYADVLNHISKPLDEHEQKLMQSSVESVYDIFVKRCADGRSLPVDSVKSLAEGRVWSGLSACSSGLVDSIAPMQSAIQEAAALAGIKEYSVVSYPDEDDFFSQLKGIPSIMYEKITSNHVLLEEKAIFEKIRQVDELQMLMPYAVSLK